MDIVIMVRTKREPELVDDYRGSTKEQESSSRNNTATNNARRLPNGSTYLEEGRGDVNKICFISSLNSRCVRTR